MMITDFHRENWWHTQKRQWIKIILRKGAERKGTTIILRVFQNKRRAMAHLDELEKREPGKYMAVDNKGQFFFPLEAQIFPFR